MPGTREELPKQGPFEMLVYTLQELQRRCISEPNPEEQERCIALLDEIYEVLGTIRGAAEVARWGEAQLAQRMLEAARCRAQNMGA